MSGTDDIYDIDEDVRTDDDQSVNQIDDAVKETHDAVQNLDNPEEINVDSGLSEQFVTDFLEGLKKLPLEQRAQLLSNLSKGSKKINHDFESVSERTRQEKLDECRKKLRELKMKRTSKVALNNYATKLQEIHDNESSKEKEKITSPEVIEVSDDDSDQTPKTLTKSQKKNRRRRGKKSVATNSATDSDTTPMEAQ